MIDDTFLSRLPPDVSVVREASMDEYTTFQLGGRCRVLINCPDAESLTAAAEAVRESGHKFLVIGQGSNLLVSDKGIDAVVLRYCSDNHSDISCEGNLVKVSGSTLLDELARLTIDKGIGDVSFCSGIPGTVGGAIAGNAGAFGQQIGDVVELVRLLEPDGAVHTVVRSDLHFEYRSSALKQTGAVVLDALLKLKPCSVDAMQKERDRILELRRSKHPDWKATPCAGSVFRNIEPTSAAERRQAAGWFLEQAGAKDLHVGGARLYEKHANIIIAGPEATALDVFTLSEQMAAAVRDRFGLDLVREIKLLGEF